MAVRSTRVVAGSFEVGAGGSVEVYTVPADRTLIVKDVRGFRTSGTAALAIAFRTPGGAYADVGVTPAGLGAFALPAGTWLVALEGDVLEVFGGVGDDFRIAVSGALLSGDPA